MCDMKLLQMSIQAAVFIAVVLVIRALAKNRLPRTVFLALWGAALIRMLVPFSIPSRISVYGLFQPAPACVRLNLTGTQGQTGNVISPHDGIGLPSPAALVWILGAALLLALLSVMAVRSCRRLRFAAPVRDNAFVENWLSERRLCRPLAVQQSDRTNTPLAVGLIRPRIILPAAMDMRDTQLLNHVLTHEYIHLRRLDMLWKLLALCALCIHWFNPMAWVLLVFLNRDLEISCDEMALRRLGLKERGAYARSLLRMAENRRALSPFSSGFGVSAMEERIKSIMRCKKSSFWMLLAAAVLVIGLSALFLTSANPRVMPQDVVLPVEERSIAYGENRDGISVKGEEEIAFIRQEINCVNGVSSEAHRGKNGEMTVYTNNGGTWTLQSGQKVEITFDTRLVDSFEGGQSAWLGYVKDGGYFRCGDDRYMLLSTTTISFVAPEDGEYQFFLANMSSDSIYVDSVCVSPE